MTEQQPIALTLMVLSQSEPGCQNTILWLASLSIFQ